MEIAVILLNWNAAEDTIRCIRDMMGWQQIQPTIWVVDNASSDDSVARIAGEYPAVRLIRNLTNVGYAGGNNQALREILTHGQVPILLMNNDAQIAEVDLVHLMRTLQNNSDIGLLGPLRLLGFLQPL